MTRHASLSASVELTGVEGEGCGPAVRAALCVAACSHQPFSFTWDAEGAGLTADGVVAAEVATAVFGGKAEGATLASRRLVFRPSPVKSGSFKVEAGARPLAPLLQMVALPLSLAGGTSQLRFSGATHVHGQPSFHDLAYGWLPVAERVGVAGEFSLLSVGFEPEGGGVVEARIYGAPRLNGLELTSRGLLVETQALALVANLGIGIAFPLERRLSERLRACGIAAQVEVLPMPAEKARGLAAVIVSQFERTRVAVVAIGRAGHPAEEVADDAVEGLQRVLRRRGALPGGTAEELLVPLAVAASPHGSPGSIGRGVLAASRISVAEVTAGLFVVADVVRRLLPVDVQIQGLPGEDGIVEVRPRSVAD